MPASASQYEGRRTLLRNRILQGLSAPFAIDALEVSPDQSMLHVTFFQDLPEDGSGNPTNLSLGNIQIMGGVRITGIHATALKVSGKILSVKVNQPGDFSTYTLRLVADPGADDPPAGFDPLLSQVDFSFKVDCPSGFDCEEPPPEPAQPAASPPIDYLAKDFASFRRLMLDRISVLAPDQTERSPADLGVALVELVAYAADQLSYFQDAVATEAYLGTARLRTSLRRHARLLDYAMHDGCNARAWVAFEVDPAADGKILPGPAENSPGTLLLAGANALAGPFDPDLLMLALESGVQPFETMHDLMLYSAHNQVKFYTWGETDACLAAGATRAWLRDEPGKRLLLRRGDVLIFEEALGPGSGLAPDADPLHRHAVRLTQVDPEAVLEIGGAGIPERSAGALRTDPLTGQAYVEIAWDAADALPFSLCLAAEIDGQPVADLSIARGNIVLADHGRTMPLTALGETAEVLQPPEAGDRERPFLSKGPLTQQARVRDQQGALRPFDPDSPASHAFTWQAGHALPAIQLAEPAAPGVNWFPQRDLLGSDRFAREFVVEVEENGLARLRFGDGTFGRLPPDITGLQATYRVGNGMSGNVGRETILHVLSTLPGLRSLRNPLAARGGMDAESLEEVRQYAPQAFRRQERAVNPEDYVAIAMGHPQIQRAQASLRWTGSWHTVFLTIDRVGGRPVDARFRDELFTFFEPYRLAGYDLEINNPEFVPLDIALTVCVREGHFRADVRRAVLDALSNRVLPGGRRGFFHPDQFTFGQPVFLSQVYTAVLAVEGVETVEATRFQRWGKSPNQELENAAILLAALEVARLDGDPNFPENGQLALTLKGGL